MDEEFEQMSSKQKSQQVTKITAQLWSQKTSKEKEEYARLKIGQAQRVQEANDSGFHHNVANLTTSKSHVRDHRLIVCQWCQKVCLGDQKFMKHQIEAHKDNLNLEGNVGMAGADGREEAAEFAEEDAENREVEVIENTLEENTRATEVVEDNTEGGNVEVVEDVGATEVVEDNTEGGEVEVVEDVGAAGAVEENGGAAAVLKDTDVAEIVLVQHNRSKWPGQVVERHGSSVTVRLYNKNWAKGKQLVMDGSQISEFVYDEALMKKTNNNELKSAYKKARKEILNKGLIN